jgi:succinoglycan biosynthesis transport protein ExoP
MQSPAFDAQLPGLSDFLSGRVEREAALQTIVHQGEDIAAVGFGRQAGAGIHRIDLLKQAVGAWSQDYEFILIDLPPVLLSADSELLIDALGQVFLVVEAQAVSKGEVARTKRLLEKLDPEAVGLFVNNIPVFDGGGYLKALIIETLTKERFSDFMSLSGLRLQVEVLRARWVQRRYK